MAKWIVDPDHAAARFTVRHMMVTPVDGLFTGVKGSVVFDPDRPEDMTVDIEVGTSTVYTGVDRRDAHLRSPDFLDVENYPAMYFRSTAVEVVGLNRVIVTGDLSLHGITRPVSFDLSYSGPSRFFDDEEQKTYTTYGITAVASLNREDFGMKWNLGIEAGGFMVGRHVDITFSAEIDLIAE